MGLLSFFSKKREPELLALPSGSFTLSREGRMMTSTLPVSFPPELVAEIGEHVLASFRRAEKSKMPMSEIIINFAALKLLARELRGGAIVFLVPQGAAKSAGKT